MVTINTSYAPEAKPVGINLSLTTVAQAIITVPDYQVPSELFGTNLVIVEGVAEIQSALVLSNKSATARKVTTTIYRASSNTSFSVGSEILVPEYDVIALPLQGQFLLTGDELRASCTANNAIDATISYTVGRAEQNDIS